MAERTAATMTTSLSFFARSAAFPEGSVGAITISSCEILRYNEWLKFRFKMDGSEEETPVKTTQSVLHVITAWRMIIRSETVLHHVTRQITSFLHLQNKTYLKENKKKKGGGEPKKKR